MNIELFVNDPSLIELDNKIKAQLEEGVAPNHVQQQIASQIDKDDADKKITMAAKRTITTRAQQLLNGCEPGMSVAQMTAADKAQSRPGASVQIQKENAKNAPNPLEEFLGDTVETKASVKRARASVGGPVTQTPDRAPAQEQLLPNCVRRVEFVDCDKAKVFIAFVGSVHAEARFAVETTGVRVNDKIHIGSRRQQAGRERSGTCCSRHDFAERRAIRCSPRQTQRRRTQEASVVVA